ncbi:MAG TPA: spore germination lipoprotein GerD [Bacillales bacterium]|nr:spore germination lipoprotein GerD [Bacillales bacterium]
MRTRLILTAVCFVFVLLSGCAGTNMPQQDASKPSYQETKRMLIDLLKTDEGKKAIEDIMSSPDMQQKLLMDQDFVKKTIQDTLTSKQGVQFWQQMLKNPKFAKTVAEAMTAQNQKLLMALMNDPKYQEMMMNILQDPEMQKQYLQLMNSKAYREQMQKVIVQTFQSPMFQEKIADLLRQVVDQELNKGNTGGQQSKQQGQPQQQGMGQSGGTQGS